MLNLKLIDKVKMTSVTSVVEANMHVVDLYLPNGLRIKSINVTEGKIANYNVLVGTDII